MGYTHGTKKTDEFRICTCCGETFPNTEEYFYKSHGRLKSLCKNCDNTINKKRNDKLKERFDNNIPIKLEYEGTKICKKCGRTLPNNYRFFPTDKSCVSGLRNICRECDPKYIKFLSENYIPKIKWSNEELRLLEENYKNYTNKELQTQFFPNRSTRSIESKANALGFSGKTQEALERSRAYQSDKVSESLTGRVITNEWKQKISDSKKEYYKTHDGWWKGKERSEEQRKLISECRKGQWAGDKNPRHIDPLTGERNGRWKGGILDTYLELRSEIKEWQNYSMEFCNYHCVITGGKFDNIHHIFPFRDIVDKCFSNTGIQVLEKSGDYSAEEFEILRNELIRLHNIYGYGACLNKDIHKLFHDVYGYTKFNLNDFLNFINRIECGEFNKWFENNNYLININYKYIEYLLNLSNSLLTA